MNVLLSLTEDMVLLEQRLGYAWSNPTLLRQSLTHSSYGNANNEQHSETLEFLGDSVLDLVTAEWLMARWPGRREGFMSQQRAELVMARTLAGHSNRLGIGRALLIRQRDQYLRTVESVLADAFEAVVGALYRDCGSLPVVRERLLEWEVLR